MADNFDVTPGTGRTVATDLIAGVDYQRVKATWGPDGTANDADVATGKPLPVQMRSATGLIPIGEPTDAKNAATDTTSVSLISVLKQLSDYLATLATNSAAATPAGSAVIGKTGVDQTNPGTTNAVSLAQVGATTVATGNGVVSAGVQRVAVASDNTAFGVTNTHLTNMGVGEYETVAASQTAQALGATGATGDYISGILVVPATTSPGNVLLLDNATSITVFTGGATSVSNLVPFFIPLGMTSVSGAWKVTTGANVSCIGIGNFT